VILLSLLFSHKHHDKPGSRADPGPKKAVFCGQFITVPRERIADGVADGIQHPGRKKFRKELPDNNPGKPPLNKIFGFIKPA
jgi:hypothetical protein